MNDLQDILKDKAYRQIHQAVRNRKVKKKKKMFHSMGKQYMPVCYELNVINSFDLENM